MPNRQKLLLDLFLTLFRTNEDHYAAIAALEYEQTGLLLAALAGPNSSRLVFSLTAVQQVEAHGLVGPELFDLLAARFPMRKALIDSVRGTLIGDGAVDAAERDMPIAGAAEPPSPSEVAAHEKIMGERPSFLDVNYLVMGYKAARGVVKLQMRFDDGIFLGTAFLIGPSRLLTAHHNLVLRTGEVAQDVAALFDYERIFEGPEAAGTSRKCLPESIRGEAADDWAVIDLAAPCEDRPPAILSETPAAVGDRVAIIQHPNGMAKQVALHNNRVTFANDTRLQYLTDTLPGSSGAPVFDATWRIVAVHHAGGHLPLPGTKELVYRNQGTPVARVLERMRSLGLSLSGAES